MRRVLLSFLFLFALLLSASCTDEESTDSETHWANSMLSCEQSSDCGEGLSCVCGVCTTECSANSNTCGELAAGAVCASGADGLPDRCSTPAPPQDGVCLETCSTDNDCIGRDIMLECVDGYCVDSREPEPDPEPQPTQPPADGVFEPIDGPPGVTVELVVDGVAYAYSSADRLAGSDQQEWHIQWRSGDGGLTWQPLEQSGVDAVLAQARTAAYAEIDGQRVLGTDDGIFRAASGSATFESIQHDLPGELERLESTGQTLVAQVDVDSVDHLYRSDDAGTSWTELETNRAGVIGFEVWNDEIFVRTFAGFEKSSDHGQTWQTLTIPPGGLPDRNNWWAETNEALYIYYRSGSAGEYVLARSTDGESWTELQLTDQVESNPKTYVVFDDELYAVSQRGVLFKIPTDGGAVDVVVDQPQGPGAVSELFSTDDALLLSGMGGSLRWEPGLTEYEVAHAGIGWTGDVEFVSGQLWATSFNSVFRYTGVDWQQIPAPVESHGWGSASFFTVDDTLYVADGSDCLFRHDGDQFTLLFQWTSTGIEPSCDSARSGNGDISNLVAMDGSIYVGQTGNYVTPTHNAGSTRPVEGGLVRFGPDMQAAETVQPGVSLSHTPHILAMQRQDDAMFVEVRDMPESGNFTRAIYRISDDGWEDVTYQVTDADGAQVSNVSLVELLATDSGAYTLVQFSGDPSPAARHAQWNEDTDSWQLLPELPAPDGHQGRILAAAETLYVAVESELYRFGEGQWEQVGVDLPDDEGRIMSLEVAGTNLYVHLLRGGVYKLTPNP